MFPSQHRFAASRGLVFRPLPLRVRATRAYAAAASLAVVLASVLRPVPALAQTTPTTTANFLPGAPNPSGAVPVQGVWSTAADGVDRFSTSPTPVGDQFHALTYPTRFNLTIGPAANLFASDCSPVDSPGLVNVAAPANGAHATVVNYGNLGSYSFAYPDGFAAASQTDGTVNLNYADLVNYGNIGTLTSRGGTNAAPGTGNW